MQEPKKYRIPWSGRSINYTAKEIESVVRAMRTADPLTQGKHQKEFEVAFARYIGVNHAFAVSSCTGALELCALLTGLKKGDEIIMPAHTFCASAISFARTGAKIVWADIDPDTRVVTAETIAKCLSSKTKVILVVHLYGLAVDMDPIIKLTKQKKIYIVEDCAQALGARYKNKKVGALGDFGCFSFHCQKNITTLGEGGMLTVRSDKMAKLVPGLRHNGVRSFGGERKKFWVPAMANVDFDLPQVWPYNFCIGEVQCALGVELLKSVDEGNIFRRKRAQKMIKALKEYPELIFQKVIDPKMHVYHLLSARYDGQKFGKTRDDLIELLVSKFKIKAIVQFYPLYRYPLFKKVGFGRACCPETDKFFDNMISFPFHLWMSDKDFNYMIDSVRQALTELRHIN